MIDTSDKIILIRRGNELFTNRDYKNALKIFLAIDYKEGIAKIASVLEHEKKDLVAALKLYKKAGLYDSADKIAYSIAQTVRFLIQEDKKREALQKGENFNTGSKISGQAPTMLPHEALIIAKQKLGIIQNTILQKYQQNISAWKPQVISKKDIDRLSKS
ncbi:MAG: hypothetical protein ACRCWI_04900 [Brevinema sp.]